MPLVLISAEAASRIRCGGRWGRVVTVASKAESLIAIDALSNESDPILPAGLPTNSWVNGGDKRQNSRWYRVSRELHGAWLAAAVRKDGAIATADFRKHIPTQFLSGQHIAVTFAPDVTSENQGQQLPEILAWHVTPDCVTPMAVEIMPETIGMKQIERNWPVATLSRSTVMVVGAGSIGGAAALDLAAYGVGRLILIDPDRLLWHNLVRHVGPSRDVGRLKVRALKDQIEGLRPDTSVEAFGLDAVTDADDVHRLLKTCAAVLCTADGVSARRVVSHLARRVRVDSVLACVLEDGAIGEVMRLRPWPGRGCLLCHRSQLQKSGSLDPEASLEAGYGSFTRPMSAVGGDLHHVASLAAKVTVASILERSGHTEQQLPGEHAIMALRPTTTWLPPYDVGQTSDVRWYGSWPSRSDCVTCGASS
ncbi:ThiF family protein [Mycolicibacterium neoaurum]|uniref:ThiF family adenylyltransferase n=1 Tax=Mycolicibacterium neoaurum TaxID=1795 RepID=UPI0008870091|nr:ThiF family protein [Mycolicibacterium neoaurum]